MNRAFNVLLPFMVIATVLTAQGVLFTMGHLVRLDYLLEEKQALRSARPVDTSLPNYDFEMLRAGIEGSATVQFVIDKAGSVTNLSLKEQTRNEFGDAAKQAVTKWKFRSAKNPPADSGLIECKFTFELVD